ncbi:MAG: AAA family ATPase [Thermoplasmata archaeon]
MNDGLEVEPWLKAPLAKARPENRNRSERTPRLLLPQNLPCIGRRGDLAELDRALRAAQGGMGSTWVFTGPAGIGKSRLLREVEQLGLRRGFRALWGYSLPHSATALFPFDQILRHLDDGTRTRSAGWPKSIAHRFLALTEAIERAADRQPLLLLLDDLNDGDAESVRMVALLARLFARQRVVLAAAFRRDVDVGEGSPGGADAALTTAQRAGFIRTVGLKPLEEHDRLTFLEAYLGGSADRPDSDDRVEHLVRRVGGNPYFLVETVAQLVAEGEIVRTRAGWRLTPEASVRAPDPSGRDDVPVNVRKLILDRYARLTPAAQETVRLAALLGAEFDTAPLAAALELPASELLALLNQLVAAGWPIRADPRRHGRFVFEHTLLQECLADLAAVRRDPRSARRLELWWEEHRPGDLITLIRLRLALEEEEAAVVAVGERVRSAMTNWESRLVPGLLSWVGKSLSPGGGADQNLTRIYLEVTQTLRERLEFDVCAKLLIDLRERDVPDATRWRVDLWRLETEVRHGAAAALAGLAEFERGLPAGATERSPELSLEIAYMHGIMALWSHPPREAWREIQGVLRRMGSSGHVFERCRLYENGVVALSNLGQLGEARRVLRKARRLARRSGLLEGPVGATFAHCQAILDRIALDGTMSARSLRRVVANYRRLALPALEAEALAELGSAEMALRRFGPCREHLAEAIRVGGRLGIESLVGYARVLGGTVDLYEGKWEAARESLEEARRLFEASPTTPLGPVIKVDLAWARTETGEAAAVRTELLALTEGPRAVPFAYEPEALRVLARAHELENDQAGSRRALRRAIACSRRIGDWPNLVGSMKESAIWARVHSTAREAARWEKHAREIARKHRLRWDTDWGGIAFRRELPGATSSLGGQGLPLKRPTPVGPRLTDMVLRCIARGAGGRTTGTGSAPDPRGITQLGIAQSIGVSRNRFAKALGRLERRGWILRRAVRFEGSPRRVLAYTITSTGSRALRQRVSEGDPSERLPVR